MISYLSGGGISMSDTDLASVYDRGAILRSLMKIKEQEQKAHQEAMHRTSRF